MEPFSVPYWGSNHLIKVYYANTVIKDGVFVPYWGSNYLIKIIMSANKTKREFPSPTGVLII